MKPLYDLNKKSKETKFDLIIFEILDSINERVSQWFESVYINTNYTTEEIETSNLLCDLDYMLTECIWLIELGESLDYKLDSKGFIETIYSDYTEKGFKSLVNDLRFDRVNDKVFTDDEIESNRIRSNEMMKKLMSEVR